MGLIRYTVSGYLAGLKNKSQQRIIVLDLIRAIAIMLVVASHTLGVLNSNYGHFFGIKNFYWVTMGGVGVTVFIILSGFVLQLKYGNGKIFNDIFSFAIKRVKKIYVEYWITLLLLFMLGAIHFTGLKDFLFNLSGLMVFANIPWARFSIAPAWFLGLIFALYVLFPIISLLFHKYGKNVIILLLLVVEIVSRILIGHDSILYRGLDWFPTARIFEFGLGMWLADTQSVVILAKKVSFKSVSVNTILLFLSEISFAVYLVHYPILFYPGLVQSNRLCTILYFLVITLFLAFLINYSSSAVVRGLRYKGEGQ